MGFNLPGAPGSCHPVMDLTCRFVRARRLASVPFMPVIGFHASHEQIHPAQLLTDVCHAEQAGFTAAMSSDHFVPWSSRQGHSGFAWAWLGAALASTDLPFGVVNAPGQRYHPAIIAQALGTLGAMYPGRIWAALGSGEAANERITGEVWPRKEIRDARLEECVDVIRRLLTGEEVSHDGLVTVNRARLWSLPDPAPHLVHAYRTGGGRGPLRLQVHLSWDPDEQQAEAIAHDQWRSNAFPPPVSWDLESPELFDIASEHVTVDQLREVVLISSDLAQHAAWLQEFLDLGFDELYLHHVGQHQGAFIDAFGSEVLPQLF
jgi:alkanesulfonate monooxygenase SsuD/methylene tetrahydromethanopterin reductase-like flavin-dependent oxidoreductase (luciferase family)